MDPITIEDWVANREVFGPSQSSGQASEAELEEAYKLELASKDKSGIIEMEGILLVASPKDSLAWIYGEKVEKINLPKNDIVVRRVDPNRKIKVKAGGWEWAGDGKARIIFKTDN